MEHGIEISREELKGIFDIVDTDGSGALSLDEFKQISSSKEANQIFKQMI
jgi:Ca2+-binding EF-hand superfamily protein